MDPKLLNRINELARLAKVRALSEEEIAERDELRKQYIVEYRASLRGILENTYIQRPDGTKEKLKPRPKS